MQPLSIFHRRMATFPLLALLALVLIACGNSGSPATPSIAEMTKGKETYNGLRSLALSVKPEDMGLKAKPGQPPEPYGVVTDIDDPKGVIYTVVALKNGDASIYFSNGGGLLGGGVAYPKVRQAAPNLVSFSKAFIPSFTKTTKFPGPSKGAVRFYILTTQGIHTAEAPMASFDGTSKLTPLFGKVNDVVSAYRESEQGK